MKLREPRCYSMKRELAKKVSEAYLKQGVIYDIFSQDPKSVLRDKISKIKGHGFAEKYVNRYGQELSELGDFFIAAAERCRSNSQLYADAATSRIPYLLIYPSFLLKKITEDPRIVEEKMMWHRFEMDLKEYGNDAKLAVIHRP